MILTMLFAKHDALFAERDALRSERDEASRTEQSDASMSASEWERTDALLRMVAGPSLRFISATTGHWRQ